MLMIYSLILCLFLITTIINGLCLPKLNKQRISTATKTVSILIPLRNEADNIEPLIQSLKMLKYANLDFILLDDQSTDKTYTLLKDAIKDDQRFQIIKGKKLPKSWIGKVHACQQLQEKATGTFLLFIDADVRLTPNVINKAITLMENEDIGLLTGFSSYDVRVLLSKLLVPMQHFFVFFHLPILLANYTKIPSTTAAQGAFMFFRRTAYDQIGGHSAVKDSLVEDVHIARAIKKGGSRVLLANITKDVFCHMYPTNKGVWQGFLKNTYPGLGRSYPLMLFLSVWYTIFYILPLCLLLYGLSTLQFLYAIPYFIIVSQKLWVDISTRQKWYLSFLIPFSAIAFIVLMHASARNSRRKGTYEWKGRYYS